MATTDPKNKWFSTPKAQRKRKPLYITLSDEARAALDAVAEKTGQSRSAIIEALVLKKRGR